MKHALYSLKKLPSPSSLEAKFQSLSMLDAILMPDWEMRFFSFNSNWASGETMASMRDGQGSEFFFLFNARGVAGKILCKDKTLGASTASALAEIPTKFSSFLEEAAFDVNTATCYLWRSPNDAEWSITPRNTVEIPLLAFVADEGKYYRDWAEGYYETEINLDTVEAIFHRQYLTEQLVSSLNPRAGLESITTDAQEIGYPH